MSGVFEGMDGITPAETAERWYARLMAPDCSLDEREQFEAWLGQSPENALAFEDTKALWASLDGLAGDEVLGRHVDAALERKTDAFIGQWVTAAQGMRPRASSRRRRNWLPIGAGIAATLALGLFLRTTLQPDTPAEPYTASDKIESVQLSDGSSVQLDLATAIDVQLTEKRRDIALRQGRVMFEVAKDARRPFVVDTGVGTITALGTKFQVQREAELVSVTLLEGIVGIASTGNRGDPRMLRLAPGQKATYTPTTQSWMVEATDVEAVTSWSEGFHIFGATPLRQAITEINRYSDVKLALAEPSVGDLVVSGSFKLGDGRTVSEALPYALPVRATEQAGRIVISKR